MIELSFITHLLQLLPLQLAPPTGAVHPYISNMITAALVITAITFALNFFYALLRRKLTDLGKIRRITKETSEWRKEYMDAVKKQDKERIEKLKKKQQYINKMSMEMMQMQFKPMMAYTIPTLLIFWTVLPVVFGNTVAVSPMPLNILGDWIPITCTTKMIEDDINLIKGDLQAKIEQKEKEGVLLANRDQVLAAADEAKELTAGGKHLDAREKILEAYRFLNVDLEQKDKLPERVPRCAAENEVFLWVWYSISYIAFQGVVMKITKTGTDTGF